MLINTWQINSLSLSLSLSDTQPSCVAHMITFGVKGLNWSLILGGQRHVFRDFVARSFSRVLNMSVWNWVTICWLTGIDASFTALNRQCRVQWTKITTEYRS